METSAAARQASPDREKILLVDDSMENLVSLEAALDGLGQELILAQSGTQALRYLLDHDFAAILLDVKMPEMDGFQTAELIRSRRRSRHTPILFLTAYKSDEHLFRGYDLGAVDFLFKPIVPEVLRSKVSVFVELRRNAALLASQAAVLRKAEEQFRSLLEAAPIAMIISSREGKINLVNSQAEVLFGYPRRDLEGQSICGLVPDWGSLPAAGFNIEMSGRRKDGSQFPAEVSLSPLETEDGILMTSAIRDVTERNRANQEIRDLNASLERRVADRTMELVASNEALRRSNDDLNQFAYAASHDLQEPLRLVALYSQLLQRKYGSTLDHQADRYISFIVDGAQRMEMLLKDLLAYSQVGSSGEGPARMVSCSEVMRQVILNLQASIEQNQAKISWKSLPTVEAHEIHLIQLFQNLVSNALKYRRSEAPRINITSKRHGAEWLFCVEDNGMGIKPEYAQHIFGIFKRLHGKDYPGTGIGLAICQRIIESYGGRIWAESDLDQGSRFYFTIPLRLPTGRSAAPELAEGK